MMMVMMRRMLAACVMIVIMTATSNHRLVSTMGVIVMPRVVRTLARSRALAGDRFLAFPASSLGFFQKPAALGLILTPLPVLFFV